MEKLIAEKLSYVVEELFASAQRTGKLSESCYIRFDAMCDFAEFMMTGVATPSWFSEEMERLRRKLKELLPTELRFLARFNRCAAKL